MSKTKYYALVENSGRVAQIEAKPFPVHPDFKWIECDETVKVDWMYIDNQFVDAAEVLNK